MTVSTQMAHAMRWERPPVDSQGFLPRSAFGADTSSSFGNNGNVAYLFGGMRESSSLNIPLPRRQIMGDLYSVRLADDDTTFQFAQLTSGTADIPQPSPRQRVGLAATDTYILIVGGLNDDGPNQTEQVVSDVSWLYSIATNTWTNVTANGPSMRFGASVVKPYGGASSSNNKFYVHGGATSMSTVLNDFWEFDASSLSWQQIVRGNPPGRQGARGFMFTNRVHFYGGFDASGNPMASLSVATLGSTSGNMWQVVPIADIDKGPSHIQPAVTPVAPGKVYIFSGELSSTDYPCGDATAPGLGELGDETYLLDTSTFGNQAIAATKVLVQGGTPSLVDGQGIYLDPYFVAVGGYNYPCSAGITEPEETHIFEEVFRLEVMLPTTAPTTASTLADGSTMAPTDAPAASTGSGATAFASTMGWLRTIFGAATIGIALMQWIAVI